MDFDFLDWYHYLLFFLVCVEMKLNLRFYGSFALDGWDLGPCQGVDYYRNGPKTKQFIYNQRCCLAPGNYTLVCKGIKHVENRIKGWNGLSNTFIEIQGHTYCGDSISYKSMERIEVIGTYGRYIVSLLLFSSRPQKRAP